MNGGVDSVLTESDGQRVGRGFCFRAVFCVDIEVRFLDGQKFHNSVFDLMNLVRQYMLLCRFEGS